MKKDEARFVAPLVDVQTWIDRRLAWAFIALLPLTIFGLPPSLRADAHAYLRSGMILFVLGTIVYRTFASRKRAHISLTRIALYVGPFSFPLRSIRRIYATRSLADGSWGVTIESKTASRVEITLSDFELADLEEISGFDVRRASIPMRLHTSQLVSTLASDRRQSAFWIVVVVYVLVNLVLGRIGMHEGLHRAAIQAIVFLFALLLREAYDQPWRVDVLAAHDGLNLRKRSWKGHFVPYSEVARVKADDRKVILGGARPVTLYAGADDVSRVADTIEMLRSAAANDASLPALLPNAEDGRTWLARLRALAAGTVGTGFRDVHVTPETLWRVVANGRATEERVAAAVALATTSDGARAKLRVLADETADRTLAKKLRAVAESEDEAALEALLEDELTENQRGGWGVP